MNYVIIVLMISNENIKNYIATSVRDGSIKGS